MAMGESRLKYFKVAVQGISGEETDSFCSSATDLVKYIVDKKAKEDGHKINEGFLQGIVR